MPHHQERKLRQLETARSKNYKDLEKIAVGFSLRLSVLVWETAESVEDISPLGECLTQYMNLFTNKRG